MSRGPAKDARKYTRADWIMLSKCFAGKVLEKDGVPWERKVKAYKRYNSRKKDNTNYKLTDCAKDFGISQAVLTRWMQEINAFYDLAEPLILIAREHAATKGSSSSTEHPEIQGILYHLRTIPNVLYDDVVLQHNLWWGAFRKWQAAEEELEKLRKKPKTEKKVVLSPEQLQRLIEDGVDKKMEQYTAPELSLENQA